MIEQITVNGVSLLVDAEYSQCYNEFDINSVYVGGSDIIELLSDEVMDDINKIGRAHV